MSTSYPGRRSTSLRYALSRLGHKSGVEQPRVFPSAVRELPGGVVEVDLPPRPDSVRAARAYVQQHWPDIDEDVLSDAALIVTELVTNAVRHGEPAIVLRLRREPFAIDVAVLDHGAALPPTRLAPVSVDSDGGRGLAIVAAMSQRWGVEPLGDEPGKTVWATIRTDG